MPPHTDPAQEEEEDDYMSMVIEEPKVKETFSQKKRREQREVQPLVPSCTHCYDMLIPPTTSLLIQ